MESSDKARRTMSQALRTDELSAEARAFLAPNGRPPASPLPQPNARPVESPAEASSRSGASLPPSAAALNLEPSPPAATVLATGVVSMTFRLPADLPAALVRASADRKVRQQKPFAQQDIVADAVRQWLRAHGFLL